jgi:hypothetical protein
MLKIIPAGVFTALAKNDLLYHATSLVNAVSIVKGDKLHMVAASDVEERKMGRADVFWVSMARTKTSSYLVSMLHGRKALGVVFECDGRKLGQVIKSTPIDYWAGSAKERGHETEERLLGRKPEIPGFSRYVKTVHVIGEAGSEQAKTSLASLVALCRRRKLPLLVYPDYKAWLARKGEVASEVAGVEVKEEPEERDERRDRNLASAHEQVKLLLEGWKPDHAAERVPGELSPRDIAGYLDANARSTYSPAIAQDIMAFMRRHKLKTTAALQAFLTDKWAEKTQLVTRRKTLVRALETWKNLHDETWLAARLEKVGENWEQYCEVWLESLREGYRAAARERRSLPWDEDAALSLVYSVRDLPAKLEAERASQALEPLLGALKARVREACGKLGQEPESAELAQAWGGALTGLVTAARKHGNLDLDPLYEGVTEVAREVRGEFHAGMSWPLYRRVVLAALNAAVGY